MAKNRQQFAIGIAFAVFLALLLFGLPKKINSYYYSTHGNAKYFYPCDPELKKQINSEKKPKHLIYKDNC